MAVLVVSTAQPLNLQRSRVVIVVRLDAPRTAYLARPFADAPRLECLVQATAREDLRAVLRVGPPPAIVNAALLKGSQTPMTRLPIGALPARPHRTSAVLSIGALTFSLARLAPGLPAIPLRPVERIGSLGFAAVGALFQRSSSSSTGGPVLTPSETARFRFRQTFHHATPIAATTITATAIQNAIPHLPFSPSVRRRSCTSAWAAADTCGCTTALHARRRDAPRPLVAHAISNSPPLRNHTRASACSHTCS